MRAIKPGKCSVGTTKIPLLPVISIAGPLSARLGSSTSSPARATIQSSSCEGTERACLDAAHTS